MLTAPILYLYRRGTEAIGARPALVPPAGIDGGFRSFGRETSAPGSLSQLSGDGNSRDEGSSPDSNLRSIKY